MKRYRTTVLLLAALVVVLAAVYIGLTLGGGEEESSSATETFTLISADRDSISALSYTYQGETVSLVQSDGVWQLESDAEFPLDSSALDMMLGCISSVTSTIPVDSQQDQSLFGLDTPQLDITATLQDGTTYTLHIGDQNSFNNRYYAQVEGTDGIYMLDGKYYSYFAHTLNDLAVPDSIPAVRTSALTALTLTNGDSRIWLEPYDPDDPQIYSDGYDFVTLAPDGTLMGADPTTAAAMATLVTGLTTESCWKYAATEADFAACGIDGSRTIRVDYLSGEALTPSSWTITLGSTAADGESLYVRVGDSSMICLMDAAAVQALLTLTPEQLRTTEVCALSSNEVDAMSITTADGLTASFTVERQGAHTADYFLNGTELSSDSFKSFLTTITTLHSVGFAAEAESSEAETLLLQVDLQRNTDAYSQVQLLLYDRGDGTCRVEFAGMTTQLVESATVETILSALETLLAA